MDNFTFNISLSVLNHLGRNLYRNFITVLGEAISNSWDADAKNVWIYIDRDNLIIKDDGEGMTKDDFQDKFLKIGYSKRKYGLNKTNLNRPFIGRKGIGKLALLSCAQKIHVLTKTENSDFVGGVIDNSELDKAINDDLTPQQYPLGNTSTKLFGNHLDNVKQGTIIYFEGINGGIKNRVEYIRKLIALFFRFSLIDDSFKITLNNDLITLDELNELSQSTQFVWKINDIVDPYLEDKISPSCEHIKQFKKLESDLKGIKGFIASVIAPKNLKISNMQEKVSLDLYVNGRLREKDILRHIQSARVVVNYIYGQIHLDLLDDDKDRFTSSREGVISDDLLFQSLLSALEEKMKIIINDWDRWRIELRQDGDPENDIQMTKKERKTKELVNIIADEFMPSKESNYREKVSKWINSLRNDAEYNSTTYTESFISENLLRNYIKYKKIDLSSKAKEAQRWRENENKNKEIANISFDLRQSTDDLAYLGMGDLAYLIEKVDTLQEASLPRDAKAYKPIRDAMAHTALLTSNARKCFTLICENVKARIKKIFE